MHKNFLKVYCYIPSLVHNKVFFSLFLSFIHYFLFIFIHSLSYFMYYYFLYILNTEIKLILHKSVLPSLVHSIYFSLFLFPFLFFIFLIFNSFLLLYSYIFKCKKIFVSYISWPVYFKIFSSFSIFVLYYTLYKYLL